jgi:hypothetical protein
MCRDAAGCDNGDQQYQAQAGDGPAIRGFGKDLIQGHPLVVDRAANAGRKIGA